MQRRQFLKLAGPILGLQACRFELFSPEPYSPKVGHLNDVHSRLNPTTVAELTRPDSPAELKSIVQKVAREGKFLSVSGGRHAMGGQQFCKDAVHIDMKRMTEVIAFDREKGLIEVEAGIEWPELIDYLLREQKNEWPQWGITQKQTGADDLSLGGAISANVHGRGVHFKPFVQDVESFQLLNAQGELMKVSREEHPELFALVVGGYGLFGVISSLTLRLSRRQKIERVVEVVPIDELEEKVRNRIEGGYTYGDFQYKTDSLADDFMQVGVFSCYKPVADDAPMVEDPRKLTNKDWNSLLYLAHTDKSQAFERYSNYYLTTNGQRYWSDTHQLSYYNDEYAEFLAKIDPSLARSSLMITEVYIPRYKLVEWTKKVAKDAREHKLDIVYGTMRLIEKDDETFLPWAKEDYACVIFNLRVEHTDAGLEKAKHDFRLLIDRSLEQGGSYFLTYHRWARKDQLLRAYPQFPEFLKLKQQYDPDERFQSEWYKHYKKMFS